MTQDAKPGDSMRHAAAISLVLITVTICALVLLSRFRTEVHGTAQDAVDTAANAVKVFKEALGLTPQVKITSIVTTQKTSEILELSTVEKQFPLEYRYSNTWMGSEKTLVLTGRYRAKAGFDLKDFALEVDEKTLVVHARFPAAKILSLQLDGYDLNQTDNGWWNKLSQQDQADAVNQMGAEARKAAEKMGIRAEARKALQTKLEEMAAKRGQKWEIEFKD